MDIVLHDPLLLREQYFVDGKWCSADHTIPILNPATGACIATVPAIGEAAIEQAIDAASAAFTLWSRTDAATRQDLLYRWYQRITEQVDDLAHIMTLEQGKPLAEAEVEIAYAASYIKWFSQEAVRLYGDVIPPLTGNNRLLVLREPVGVVGVITPWNFPMAMIARKVAAAFAAGCTVIIKPASETPLSALALARIAEEVGFPKGVVNVITGDAQMIGTALCASRKVKKISFTGSTAVGKKLYQQSADSVKKLSLELGGNAPFIIFADADIDKAVAGLMQSKFRNNGQTCVCANRVYIHEDIVDTILPLLITKMQALQLGSGLDKAVTQGPLINQAAVSHIEALIQDAIAKGAEILMGGKQSDQGALFVEPTLLTHVTDEMRCFQEEIFGPILAISHFTTEDEVIERANATSAGLVAYAYTTNFSCMRRLEQALEYGMVGINTGMVSTVNAPFGGVKESGFGREGSYMGILEYLNVKYIAQSD